MASALSGLIGGLVGALAGAALRRAASDDPALPAVVWAKYLGDGDPTGYDRHGLFVHSGYGALAGLVFVWLADWLSLGLATPADALFAAVGWAVVLALVALGWWSWLLAGIRPNLRGLGELAAVHLAFGVVLGLWVYAVPGG